MNAALRPPGPDLDDPALWCGTSPLLDLEDTRLRLRVQALTQLCTTDRQKILALYGSVKRIPFGKPFKMRPHTAREVLECDRADASDKATLLVALLRLAGFAARMRFLTLKVEVFRGLVLGLPEPTRPVVEVFRAGDWVRTDTYIFDAAYVGAARQRLARLGWEHGLGLRLDGEMLWDGQDDALLLGRGIADDPLVVRDHGVFCDPLEFVSSDSYWSLHARLPRALHWNLVAPRMDRAIRDLRDEAAHPTAAEREEPWSRR